MLGLPLLLAVAAAGCTTSARGPAAKVMVQPRMSLADQPVHIRVTGLAAGQHAAVQISSVDAAGVRWQSSAVYAAGAAGGVDLSGAPALSGSYRGVSGMGLIWSMQPAGPDQIGAYFKEPGLPQTLSKIPLEYFAKALTWLARQPGADRGRIAVLGVSRGSEAAQLLGVYYPGLVHAVIASVPSDAAICSNPGCAGPAWTLHRQALPYTREFDNPYLADDPAAVIPDQRINGPVFLDCAEADQTWTSCPYARAILNLLDAHHDRWVHVLYAYPGAGHLAGSLIPYEPYGPAQVIASGPAYQANQEADGQLWPHLLGFLASLAASRDG
jgi:dienelactone hydrolase